MENLQACRVCLATNVRLYDMYKYKLKNAFEVISGIQMSPADRYLQYLCTYCSRLLIKCGTFRDKCRSSQDLMNYAATNNRILTLPQINSLAVSNNTHLPFTTTKPEITSISTIFKTEDLDVDMVKEEFIDESDDEPLANKVKKNDIIDDLEDPCTQDDIGFNDFDASLEVFGQEKDVKLPMNDIKVICLTKEEQLKELLARKESYNYIHSFYKCSHCYKGFLRDCTYKNHMLRHDPSYGKESCDICKTRWPDLRSLKSHTTAAHEKKFICKLCDQSFKSSHKAKEHLQWHRGHKFICKICGASFSKSTSHLTHLRLQHPTKYCCEICGESFLGEMGLNMHIKKSHRGFDKLTVKTEFKCNVCGVFFKCIEALTRHNSSFENNICDNSVSSCFHCGENLLSQELLKDHMKTHDMVVRCDECNKDFANDRSFSIHYQRVHLGIKMKQYKPKNMRKKVVWVCEMCGKKCVSNAALVYHQRTHTGEKPFQCKECPKRFSIYQRLKIHVRTHTGERPFKCSSCPKAFKQKAALNTHNRVHSGAKPYQCGHCGKSFSQSNSMKLHVRTVHLKLPAPYRSRRNKNTELEALEH